MTLTCRLTRCRARISRPCRPHIDLLSTSAIHFASYVRLTVTSPLSVRMRMEVNSGRFVWEFGGIEVEVKDKWGIGVSILAISEHQAVLEIRLTAFLPVQ